MSLTPPPRGNELCCESENYHVMRPHWEENDIRHGQSITCGTGAIAGRRQAFRVQGDDLFNNRFPCSVI